MELLIPEWFAGLIGGLFVGHLVALALSYLRARQKLSMGDARHFATVVGVVSITAGLGFVYAAISAQSMALQTLWGWFGGSWVATSLALLPLFLRLLRYPSRQTARAEAPSILVKIPDELQPYRLIEGSRTTEIVAEFEKLRTLEKAAFYNAVFDTLNDPDCSEEDATRLWIILRENLQPIIDREQDDDLPKAVLSHVFSIHPNLQESKVWMFQILTDLLGKPRFGNWLRQATPKDLEWFIAQFALSDSYKVAESTGSVLPLIAQYLTEEQVDRVVTAALHNSQISGAGGAKKALKQFLFVTSTKGNQALREELEVKLGLRSPSETFRIG